MTSIDYELKNLLSKGSRNPEEVGTIVGEVAGHVLAARVLWNATRAAKRKDWLPAIYYVALWIGLTNNASNGRRERTLRNSNRQSVLNRNIHYSFN